MAFDGITVACLRSELDHVLKDARIMKIAQTEKDELILTCKCATASADKGQVRLLLSAQASLPLAVFTDVPKKAPDTAPAFCMLLRKYLQNGRVSSVEQPSLERVLRFHISHYDEMGDLKTYTLIIELMGKHSNIILIDEKDTILDAIKHITSAVSSVREVLPGRTYFLPDPQKKRDPFEITDVVTLTETLKTGKDDGALQARLVGRLSGISPLAARELACRARLDADAHVDTLSYEDRDRLLSALMQMTGEIREEAFSPRIYEEAHRFTEYAALPLTCLEAHQNAGDEEGPRVIPYESMSEVIRVFYAEKAVRSRIRNRSADLRTQVVTVLKRTVRKYDQQLNELKDTEKKDVMRLRGELLTAYAHEIAPGEKEVRLTDYHTGKEVTIPLDEQLSASANAQKYFDRYARMKRTAERLSELTKETEAEIAHLKSVRIALDLATDETELKEIRSELADSGYLKKAKADRSAKKGTKGAKGEKYTEKSAPLHYVTSDGFDVYVGKNNAQNDRLTFHGQGKGDVWFHAKGMPGSHVVLRADKDRSFPDRAYEEAASLAAFYSAGVENGKVEVDYTELKNVKKPAKAKPGFVVYYTNYSMVADTDISALKQAET